MESIIIGDKHSTEDIYLMCEWVTYNKGELTINHPVYRRVNTLVSDYSIVEQAASVTISLNKEDMVVFKLKFGL